MRASDHVGVAVTCTNIQKIFKSGTTQVAALRGVNLEVKKGELLMLMGPSGSGKTTLLSIIAGILTPTSGECFINSTALHTLSDAEKTNYRGKHIGFVFQAFNLIPMLSTLENIAIPLLLNGIDKQSALKQAAQLLNDVGIPEKAFIFPNQLSGGEQQRVAIARAVIHNPDLIICDEPTSFLDHASGNKIMELLRSIAVNQGKTLIVVSHDPRITSFADRIKHLEDGQILT